MLTISFTYYVSKIKYKIEKHIIDVFIFELCIKNGFLKHEYTRSQLLLCNEISLDFKTLLKSYEEKKIQLYNFDKQQDIIVIWTHKTIKDVTIR